MITTTSPLMRRFKLVLAMFVVVALSAGSIQMASAQPNHASAHHAKVNKAKGQKHGKRWAERQYRKAQKDMRKHGRVPGHPGKCRYPTAYKRLKSIRPWGTKLWGGNYWADYAESAFGSGYKKRAKRLARHGIRVMKSPSDANRTSSGAAITMSDIKMGFFEIYWCK